MKKTIMVFCMILGMTACGNNWREKATPTEQAFLIKIEDKSLNSCTKYIRTRAAISLRSRRPLGDQVNSICSVYSAVITDEATTCQSSNTKLDIFYEALVGKKLSQICKKDFGTTPTFKPNDVAPTVTGGEVIVPQLYASLIDAAKTCKRAEQAIMKLTYNRVLVAKDAAEVHDIISKCNQFKLEVELNSK